MATDVLMPQMGESIAEGTVSRWIKKVGDKVERDEPLLEISTDKVDAEIPSPTAGTLTEVLVKEGQTVAVNSVVARIAAEGEAAAASKPAAAAEKPKPAPPEKPKTPAPEKPKPAESAAAPQKPAPPAPPTDNLTSLEERRRTKSSPLVRKIAKENNVDIAQIQGSGVSGRVTKNDILGFLQQPREAAAEGGGAPQRAASGATVRMEPLSVMRKKIAQHMVLSKQTSAHVTTAFEVDFTAIEKLRQQHKQTYAERDAKLTYLPFIVQAVIDGLREFPIVNASMDENNIIYHSEFNIGIAVALEWGLIVPVLKHADEKNILGIARGISDLGERARTKKLSPDDVQGGTFTITNPGVFGGLFGTPIINQPQVAILGVGGVHKRPVVVETEAGDSIAIRSMCILTLTFDHRLIDGAVADQFMAHVKSVIESGQFTM
ncbi:MAG TPA: 2-oxoglutarate dehydrogenase, E2 component, dihydrolipoamide succinyltransferase [Thermoanaerobaculia bacterium]|jgi:2-oxoglutarate dehydrogenase E2 component (dihydrolipoamide succinyltransferase)|nr:2-oxoglutarate dehydrogenase, E2 component, dihydrolipoamide succinyltransferase [Thermoanaerobaculia bacterium]